MSTVQILLTVISLVLGAALLLVVEVHWPLLTVYLTGLHLDALLSDDEYDPALVARLLNTLGGGVEGGRLGAAERQLLLRCIEELEGIGVTEQ